MPFHVIFSMCFPCESLKNAFKAPFQRRSPAARRLRAVGARQRGVDALRAEAELRAQRPQGAEGCSGCEMVAALARLHGHEARLRLLCKGSKMKLKADEKQVEDRS